jgi:hypothetical protein
MSESGPNVVTDYAGGLNARPEPDPRRWGILAVVVVAQLMIVLDASIVTIALPSAQHALHISTANRQWVITAYTLAFGGLLLLGGRIADFSGRKRVFVVGLLGFAGASALGGLAPNEAMLFAASSTTRRNARRHSERTARFPELAEQSACSLAGSSRNTPHGAGAFL